MKNLALFVLPLLGIAAALVFVLFSHLEPIGAPASAKPLAHAGISDAEFAELLN